MPKMFRGGVGWITQGWVKVGWVGHAGVEWVKVGRLCRGGWGGVGLGRLALIMVRWGDLSGYIRGRDPFR